MLPPPGLNRERLIIQIEQMPHISLRWVTPDAWRAVANRRLKSACEPVYLSDNVRSPKVTNTMNGRFVSYYRVSTAQQGRSGLGLDAQRDAVRNFLNGGEWTLTGEFTEVESGKRTDRPQLDAALALCRLTGATLIVAKLDRLARNVRFLLSVVEGTGDAGVVFCDLPTIPPGAMGKFFVTQMAAVAQLEAGLISERTRDALAKSPKRLGGYRGGPKVDPAAGLRSRQKRAAAYAAAVRPTIADLRSRGLSLRSVCTELAERGIRTPNGGKWTAQTVTKILAPH
jgi:DNA invertase Pin-like site-specific DNA recombinase